MKYLNKGLIGLFLLTVTVSLLLASLAMLRSIYKENANKKTFGRNQERSYAVPVGIFQQSNFFPEIQSFGEIESQNSLELRSPTAGTVQFVSVNFRDGASVKKGELLYKIDPVDAQNNLDMVRVGLQEILAEKESAEASINLLEKELMFVEKQLQLRQENFNRQVELSKSEIVTQSSVENAELNLAISEQSVLSRKSALSQARTRLKLSEIAIEKQNLEMQKAERTLRDTEFYSPFDAIVSKVSAIPGRLVNVGEKLGLLIDPLALEVSFQLSNEDFNKIVDDNLEIIGLPLFVGLVLKDRKVLIKGEISRMASEVMAGASGKKIYASLETFPNTLLRPGDFVKVTIKEKEMKSVFVVPASSVDPDNKILILTDNGRLKELKIELLRRQGDSLVIKNAPSGVEYVVRRTPQLGTDLKIDPIRKEDIEKAVDSYGKIREIKEELIKLDDEKRQFYIQKIKENKWMPDSAKERMLSALSQEKVPKKLIDRLEQRMNRN